MALLEIRMHLLQLTWTLLVVPFSGMLALFEWPTARRWTSWLPSSLVVFH
jgi:hypothetical protein